MWLQTLNEWNVWAKDVAWGRIAFDTETSGLEWPTLEMWGLSVCDGTNSCYVNLHDNPERGALLEAIWGRLVTTKVLIGHNLTFDFKVLLKTYGEQANHWVMGVTLVDTYVADVLLNYGAKHSLKGAKGCLERYLGVTAMEFDSASKHGPDSRVFAEYAEADAVNTLHLWEAIRPKLVADALEKVFKLECGFIPVLVEMESVGVWCNKEVLVELGNRLNNRKYELLGEIDALFQAELLQPNGLLFSTSATEDTLSSPLKMAAFLRDQLGFDVQNADYETMMMCAATDTRLNKVIEYHKVCKLLSTYVDGVGKHIDPDGRARPSYRMVSTGRLAASSPNLQNQPKEAEEVPGVDVRTMWQPAAGNKFLRADYSQFQLRIAAHNSGDATMLKAFNEGYDVHMLVANQGKQLGIPVADLKESSPKFKAIKKQYEAERTKFKAANFGLLFERSAANLAKDWGCSRDEAQNVVDSVYRMFPNIQKLMFMWHDYIRRTGVAISLMGRKQQFALPVDNHNLRAGWCHTIQSTEADIIKIAMRQVWNLLRLGGWKTRLVWQIHDEIILEGPEIELKQLQKDVERIMCMAVPLKCKVVVESGIVSSYGEK